MKNWMKNEIHGQGSSSHDKVMHEAGVTREQLWIQRTPMGDFAVVSYEVETPEKAFKVLGNSTDPWAARFRDLLKQVHGIDVKQPMPTNEQPLDWKVTEKTRV